MGFMWSSSCWMMLNCADNLFLPFFFCFLHFLCSVMNHTVVCLGLFLSHIVSSKVRKSNEIIDFFKLSFSFSFFTLQCFQYRLYIDTDCLWTVILKNIPVTYIHFKKGQGFGNNIKHAGMFLQLKHLISSRFKQSKAESSEILQI